jgi:tetratricopeptide (TPR) repeat protein
MMARVDALGDLLRLKGDYVEAETLCRRALEGYEKSLGEGHPDTLRTVCRLVDVLNIKQDYDAAEILARRALEGYENTFGIEHPDTLLVLSNSSVILESSENYEGAEFMYRRILKTRTNMLGKENADTLQTVADLGRILNLTNRRREALQLHRNWAKYSERIMDDSFYNLVCYECLEGNLKKAKTLVSKYIAQHPEKKEQALSDPDLAAIRDFIETL